MIDNFDIDNLFKNTYHVGFITQEVITLLGFTRLETSILFGKDKIKYTEKHKHKFVDAASYKKHIEAVPQIISDFDYVALHPSNNSIEYIKKLDEIMVVAVRGKEVLWVKTVFPISEDKLNLYKISGTLKSRKEIIWLIDIIKIQ